MQETHQNIGHAAASEPKITSPHLVQQIARAALRKVPGVQGILDKHFRKDIVQTTLKPKPVENLLFHSGYEFGR